MVMESVRSGGGSGRRQRAVTVTVVAAVLLTVVDVLTAFDDYDDFSKLRRRHRIRQAVKEGDEIYHRETSSISRLR